MDRYKRILILLVLFSFPAFGQYYPSEHTGGKIDTTINKLGWDQTNNKFVISADSIRIFHTNESFGTYRTTEAEYNSAYIGFGAFENEPFPTTDYYSTLDILASGIFVETYQVDVGALLIGSLSINGATGLTNLYGYSKASLGDIDGVSNNAYISADQSVSGVLARGDYMYLGDPYDELAGYKLTIDNINGKLILFGDSSRANGDFKIDKNLTVAGNIVNTNLSNTYYDTLSYNWGVVDTVITGVLPGWKMPNNITIVEVAAYTDANTVTFNLEERGEITPNTAGTDVMAADLVADNDQQEQTSFSNANIDKNNWLVPTISATGDVEVFSITIRYIKR